MKGYSEKKLRDLLKEKEKQLDELNTQAEDLQELLNLSKHSEAPMASIPTIAEEHLKTALDTINKKCETLTLIINCVNDNLRRIDEAKKQYEEIYISQYNDSMFMLEKIKV